MHHVTASLGNLRRIFLRTIAVLLVIGSIAILTLSGCAPQTDMEVHIAILNHDGSIETHDIEFSADSSWIPPVKTNGRSWIVYAPDTLQMQSVYKFMTTDWRNLEIRQEISEMSMDNCYAVLDKAKVGPPTKDDHQWLNESGYFVLESKNSSGEVIFTRRFQMFTGNNDTSDL
jgi:hypothetical protein